MIKLSSKKKFYLFFPIVVISLIVIGALSFYFVALSKVPQMSGELSISGLKKQVRVERDHFGVPHIFAENNLDAFRSLGFIMASERLFQMDISRLLARGELASLIGEKALESDLLYRNLGLRDHAEKWLVKKLKDHTFDPEMLSESQAFYDGVNQFIEHGPTPIEYLILGGRPKKFSMVDGMSFMGLMSFSFGLAPTMDTLLSKLIKRPGLSEDLVEDMRIEKIPSSKQRYVYTDESLDSDLDKKITSVMSGLENAYTLFEGSNGWVLSGERSKSGKPILANDPHITFSFPGVWFEAHIKTPTYEQYGHFLPGVPFPVHAFNRERGWGLTMSLVDDMDLYSEKINEQNKTYTFKGEELPLIERLEIIKIKKKPDVGLKVYSTAHGPILEAALKNRDKSETLSLQWAFFDPENDPMTALYFMGKAHSMEDFKKAVATGKAPGLNMMYADHQNIGWWLFGEVWQKRKGLKTDQILNGESGNDEILRSLPFEKKPHLENPASGIIITANTRPLGYPEGMRGDWQASDRKNTLESIFAQKKVWSVDEMKEIQTLSMDFENKKILKYLLNELGTLSSADREEYKEAITILKDWDYISSVDSLAPSLYYTWCYQIINDLLALDLSIDEKEMVTKGPNAWIFFQRILENKNSPWWIKFNRNLLITSAFKDSIKKLKDHLGPDSHEWKWGRLHTIEFVHPIGRVPPMNKIFNLGPYPAPGSTHEVNNFKFTGLLDGFKVKAGPSTRKIIDFDHPENSWGILPVGNSGHLLSPFYKDQVELFLAGKYRSLSLDLKDSDVSYKLILNPN